MKGLIVKWRENVYKAGIPDCGVGFIVNITREDGAFWNLSGTRMPEKIRMTWNGGMLEVGDELEIEFAEFDEATPPVVQEKCKPILEEISALPNDTPEIWKRKLDTYHRLKKILEDENLIEKE